MMEGKQWVKGWGMYRWNRRSISMHVGGRNKQQQGLRSRKQCSKQDISEQKYSQRKGENNVFRTKA